MNRPLAFSRRQALLGGAALLVACGSDESVPVTGVTPTPSPLASPVPAGSRILGISPTERQDGNFDAVIANLQNARVSNATISFAWDDIETSPGTYAPDPNFPAIANLYYPAMGVSLTVVIVGIDTTADRRPADLQGLAWDDPRIVTRFRAMQDWLIEQLRDVTITAWSIGNEVDAALADDAASWRAWRRFFEQVAPPARARLGNVPVGSIAKMGSEPIWALSLSPAAPIVLGSRVTTCASFALCARDCVAFSGKGTVSNVIGARNARTAFLVDDPESFGIILAHEIAAIPAALARKGNPGAKWRIRLNAYSDLSWEIGASWVFPLIVRNGGAAYDYTKDKRRMRETMPAGYRLTYSATSKTTADEIRAVVANGHNVAIVGRTLKGAPIPSTIAGLPVVNGDASESRYDDAAGSIVYLSVKGTGRAYRNSDVSGTVLVSDAVWNTRGAMVDAS